MLPGPRRGWQRPESKAAGGGSRLAARGWGGATDAVGQKVAHPGKGKEKPKAGGLTFRWLAQP